MRKSQNQHPHQVLEFSQLNQKHKVEFINFLIKNNINFQEGKQNCEAKFTIKKDSKENQHERSQDKNKSKQIKKDKNQQKKENYKGIKNNQRSEILIKDLNNYQMQTPTKKPQKLFSSSLSCKNRTNTLQKQALNKTPKNKTFRILNEDNQKHKRSSSSNLKVKKQNINENSANMNMISIKNKKKERQNSRDKIKTKYSKFFEIDLNHQRPIRWPIMLLEKTIQQIYDEIFIKNTQCLQNKSYNNALKILNQNTFNNLIDLHFRKKFKESSKLIASNLNNMLYSLSFYIEKEGSSFFLTNFQNFILQGYQNEDLLFYLFTRNMIKKQLKLHERHGDIAKGEQSLIGQMVMRKQINKFLKCLVGQDDDILQEYKDMVNEKMHNQKIQVYGLLNLLVDDFHHKRLNSYKSDKDYAENNYDSFGNTIRELNNASLFKDQNFMERKNTDQLTFGEESLDDNDQQDVGFWNCQDYEVISDKLFDMICSKLEQKVDELMQLLSQDDEVEKKIIERCKMELFWKGKSLINSIFEMNKIKWFKELKICSPNEKDMEVVENMQMRIKRLKYEPSSKEIGQFCKSLLTIKEITIQLEKAIN